MLQNMLYGYARVSTNDQDTAAQVEALKAAGCDSKSIVREYASGGEWERPKLHKLLDQLEPGDVLVVWKLDRLSRSLKDLLVILETIAARQAEFRSLTESVFDSTTAAGRLMLQIVGAFAEFERAMIRERTKVGLRSAQSRGQHCGRAFKFTPAQQSEIFRTVNSGQKSVADMARMLGVHRATIHRLVSRFEAEQVG
jgi:DNA invertase Pin-like site-specific DNA recombinase